MGKGLPLQHSARAAVQSGTSRPPERTAYTCNSTPESVAHRHAGTDPCQDLSARLGGLGTAPHWEAPFTSWGMRCEVDSFSKSTFVCCVIFFFLSTMVKYIFFQRKPFTCLQSLIQCSAQPRSPSMSSRCHRLRDCL